MNYNKSKWILALIIVAAFAVFFIIVLFSNTPVATWSADSIPDSFQKRDMSTPSSRLVGHWISENGSHELYYNLIDHSLKIGTYILDNYNTKPSSPIKLKILSEESNGTQLIMRTFPDTTKLEAVTGLDFTKSDIECCIPKDGQSMSQEYTFLGERHLNIYHYVDGRVDPSSSFIPYHPK
jgi:hypothetical protein